MEEFINLRGYFSKERGKIYDIIKVLSKCFELVRVDDSPYMGFIFVRLANSIVFLQSLDDKLYVIEQNVKTNIDLERIQHNLNVIKTNIEKIAVITNETTSFYTSFHTKEERQSLSLDKKTPEHFCIVIRDLLDEVRNNTDEITNILFKNIRPINYKTSQSPNPRLVAGPPDLTESKKLLDVLPPNPYPNLTHTTLERENEIMEGGFRKKYLKYKNKYMILKKLHY